MVFGKKKKKKEENSYSDGLLPVIEDDMISIGDKSDFSKSLEVMFNDENFEKKTDLSPRQISKLNKIRQMAEYYDVDLLKELYERFLNLRVSRGRKGREEGVNMTQQIAQFKRLEAIENIERERRRK